MNYRHLYHAGNFADVFKHLIVMLAVERLAAKPAAFCVVDTHAGLGLYDLQAPGALKTGEADRGIGRLWRDGDDLPGSVRRFLALIGAVNRDQGVAVGQGERAPRWYPGSPWLVRRLLRPGDRQVLCELHPEEVAALRRLYAGTSGAAIHQADGYQGLKAHLPPPERRGLVLVDPPFEARDEADRLVRGLVTGHRRWPQGVFLLWYPIKERPAVWRLHEAAAATGIRRLLTAELTITGEEDSARLNGCGMLLVNPPWQLDQELAALLPAVHRRLAVDGAGGTRVVWLVGE